MASVLLPARRLMLRSNPIVCVRPLPPLHRALDIPSPFQRALVPAILVPLTTTIFAQLNDVITSIWESILLAVPKKKTSYSKSRSRRHAGKALRDITSLNYCSSCGRVKRAHTLCTHCVTLVQDMWNNNTTEPHAQKLKRSNTKEISTTNLPRMEEPKAQPKNSWKDKLQSFWRK